MSARIADLFSVEGKVVVITGGSRGIGAMIAQGFLEAGARVYITARKADACEATAQELSAFGDCRAVPADISTSAGVERLRDRIADECQQVGVLVNNAGGDLGRLSRVLSSCRLRQAVGHECDRRLRAHGGSPPVAAGGGAAGGSGPCDQCGLGRGDDRIR